MKRFLLVFIYVLTTISMDAQNGTNDIVIEWMNVPGQTHYSYIKESRILSPIQISIIASVLRPNVPNTPILSVDQPPN